MHTLNFHSSRAARLGAIGLVAGLALGLAACSTDSPTDPSPDGALEVTELNVAIVPVVDHAAMFVAIEEGYFSDEGLTVTAQPAQGGAASVPAMIAGDFDAAFSTYPTFLLAKANGIDLTIVSESVRGNERSAGVYVRGDSTLQSIEDLAGRTIAVNTLNNSGDLSVKALLVEAGVDLNAVEFIELGFTDMGPTLEAGNVDAVWVVEPFMTNLAAQGHRMLFSSYEGITANIPGAGVGMTTEFVNAHPNTTAAFVRAFQKANALIASDPELARKIVPTYSSTTAELAAQIALPDWVSGPSDVSKLQMWNDIMVDLGSLSSSVDINGMLYKP